MRIIVTQHVFVKKWHQRVTMLCYPKWICFKTLHGNEQLMTWAFHFWSQKLRPTCQFGERGPQSWNSLPFWQMCIMYTNHFIHKKVATIRDNAMLSKLNSMSNNSQLWTAYDLSFPFPVPKVAYIMPVLRTRHIRLVQLQACHLSPVPVERLMWGKQRCVIKTQ